MQSMLTEPESKAEPNEEAAQKKTASGRQFQALQTEPEGSKGQGMTLAKICETINFNMCY